MLLRLFTVHVRSSRSTLIILVQLVRLELTKETDLQLGGVAWPLRLYSIHCVYLVRLAGVELAQEP